MGYFDKIKVPDTGKTKGGYFDRISVPADPIRAQKLYKIEGENQLAARNAEYASRFSTIAGRTLNPINLAKGAGTVAKDIARGLVEFGISAGEAPLRLSTFGSKNADFSNRSYEPTKIPGLGILGPVESFQNRAIRQKAEGASNLGAISRGIFDTIINEPTGVALKPLLVSLGFAAKVVSKIKKGRGEISVGDITSFLKENPDAAPRQVLESFVPKSAPQTTQARTYFDSIKVPGEPAPLAPQNLIEAPGNVINTRAQTLEKAAIEKKLVQGLGDLPTHNRISMSAQADEAARFVYDSPDEALKVALGDAPSPGRILPESVYTALEIKAIREGNVELIQALSKSKVPTLAGQSLKALDSVDPNSPVRILREIQNSLTAKVERNGVKITKQKAESVKSMQKEITAAASKRPSWESFLNEITCGY